MVNSVSLEELKVAFSEYSFKKGYFDALYMQWVVDNPEEAARIETPFQQEDDRYIEGWETANDVIRARKYGTVE
jgi:hypothetical protein